MPYIKRPDRKRLAEDGEPATNAGELNFVITMHAVDLLLSGDQSQRLNSLGFFAAGVEIETEKFLAHRRRRGNQFQRNKNTYQDYNDVMGVLTCARREFERRFGSYGLPDEALNVLEEYASRFYRNTVAPYEDIKIRENGDVL